MIYNYKMIEEVLKKVGAKGFISFEEIMQYHKKDVHYKRKCPRDCHQKEHCNVMRKCFQFSEKIVHELRSRDGLLRHLQKPFVVGSLKEGTRLFSLGI